MDNTNGCGGRIDTKDGNKEENGHKLNSFTIKDIDEEDFVSYPDEKYRLSNEYESSSEARIP